MLSRRLFTNFKVMNNARALQFARAFSSEAEKGDAAKVPEPTQHELEAGRQEWGIKYDDECLKFEKEWNLIVE